MIATGNHNFERFAALCNTPEVEPRALRAANNVTEKTKEDSTETSILPALVWTKIYFRR